MKNKILSGLSIGIMLQWFALFFSTRRLPVVIENDFTQPVATGGFPLKVFEYPFPPMGNNWPPPEAWPLFFLNLGIWLAIGVVVTMVLGKRFEKTGTLRHLAFFAVFFSVIGMYFIMLKFD